MITPDRFEEHRPMLLAGLRRTYAFHEAPTAIPEAWKAFVPSLPLPGQVGVVAYGAVCGADIASFEYMCAAEVETFDGLGPAWGRMRIPAAKYAVFVHQGPLAFIRRTIEASHHWLGSNGRWADGHTPTFERYGPAFDPETGADIEMWLPVVPAS